MSRFGTGLGFNIQDIALIGGIATEIFNANVAQFNGTTMHTNATYTNSAIVTESAFMAWIKVEVGAISSPTIIGFNNTITGHSLELRYQTIANVVACNVYNGSFLAGTSSPVSIEDGEFHLIGMNYLNGFFEFFVDGISVGTGTMNSSTRITIADYSGTNGAGAYKGGMYRPEVYERNLTQEEWTFKALDPTKCRALEIAEMPSLADSVYSPALYNHAGFTGQEYVDQSDSGLTTTPSVTIPFTGSAQIECEPYTPPVDIQWTQDFSLLDPVTDVVYGIDPAVTTWIDKGTSSTNLTQTTVVTQADLVAGEMVFDDNANYNGVEPQAGDWSYYFEIDMTSALGVDAHLISGNGNIKKFGSNNFRLEPSTGGAVVFSGYIITAGIKKLVFVREVDSVRLYENGVLVSTVSTVGKTFNGYTRLGLTSSQSMNSDLKAFKVLDRALTDQEAIDETT